MLQWLHDTTMTPPPELTAAYGRVHRALMLDRYRSRNAVSQDTIETAYSWFGLESTTEGVPGREASYITRALARGTNPEEAVNEAVDVVNYYRARPKELVTITINTYTNQEAEEALPAKLLEMGLTEVPMRAMLTVNPAHRIHMYASLSEGNNFLVILTNQYSDEIVFKIAAVTANLLNYLPEIAQQLHSGYHEGNAQTIYTVLTDYYKDAREARRIAAINNTLNGLETRYANTRKRQLENKVNEAQASYENALERVQLYYTKLTEAKAAYSLFYIQDEEQAITDLKQFLMSCVDKLHYVDYTDNTIYVVYSTPLMYWDEKPFDAYLSSNRQNVVNEQDAPLKQLLIDIFKNKSIELQMCSGFALNLNNGSINYINPLNYCTAMHNYKDMPGVCNPHHHHYNCWGDYAVNISRAVAIDGNLVNGILQAFAAIAGINLVDVAVLTRFCERTLIDFAETYCLRVKETGEMITIKEYIRRYSENVSNSND